MKSIKIEDKTWKKLMRWKVDYGYKSLDEIIERILKIIPASELNKKEVNKK